MRIERWLIVLSCAAVLSGKDPAGDRIGARMQEMIESKEIPGAVTLIAAREGIQHFAATGTAGKKPLKKDAIFWIASMTKPITGVAVMMLQEEGKLSVDDPVSKYLPEFGALPHVVTVKHLMTHTSGLPEATPDEMKRARNLAELMPAHLNKPMLFEPGSKWVYSQSGINTLGRIVEVLSGRPFEKFLEERLFRPLAMKDTTFYVRPQQMARVVAPVKREADGSLTETAVGLLQGKAPTSTDRYPAANGGLYSTASDYARFARMLLNSGTLEGKRYLKSETIRQMTTIQTGDLKTGFTPGNGWGLTFCVVLEPQGITSLLSPGTYGHGGAYGTQAWIDPTKGIALILMVQRANFENSDNSPVRRAFQEAALSPR